MPPEPSDPPTSVISGEPGESPKPAKLSALGLHRLKLKNKIILHQKSLTRLAVFLATGAVLFFTLTHWTTLSRLAAQVRSTPFISPAGPLPPLPVPMTVVNDPSLPGTEAYFTALIAKEPANPKWYFERGLLRYEHRSLTDPIQPIFDDFVTASRLSHEKDPAALFYRGLVSGNPADYDRALEVKPDYADAFLYRGLDSLKKWSALDFDGKKEEAKPYAAKALSDLNRAVELNHQSGPYHLGRGWAALCMANLEEARGDLSEATELMPDNPNAWSAYGECLKEEGLEEKALECYAWAQSLGGSTGHRERIGALLERTESSPASGVSPTPTAAPRVSSEKKNQFSVNVSPNFIVAFQSAAQGDGRDPGHISLPGYLHAPPKGFTLAPLQKKRADYSTFQSAALSALAADKSGHLKKIVESYHPEDREAMKYQLGKASERRKYLNNLKGVKTIQVCGVVYSSHPLVLIRFNQKTKGGLVMALRYSQGHWLRSGVTSQKADFERVKDVFLSGTGYGKGYGVIQKRP